MTNTQVFQALEDEPWALLDMHDPSPDMKFHIVLATSRCGKSVFQSDINTRSHSTEV